MNKKGLGKGLGAIFGDAADPVNTAVEPVRSDEEKKELLLKDIVPNPHQPRQVFDAVKLAELVESIKLHGVIQPLVVRKHVPSRSSTLASACAACPLSLPMPAMTHIPCGSIKI